MGNMILSVLVDSIMVGLLLATILYCMRLNRRIKELQDGKSELARIIREFDESTTRATQNINEIHAATNRISENIQIKIDKANYLANDLDMLIERSNKVLGKPAEPSVRSAPPRVEPVAARSPEVEAVAESRRPLRGRSRAEQDLISMLGRKSET